MYLLLIWLQLMCSNNKCNHFTIFFFFTSRLLYPADVLLMLVGCYEEVRERQSKLCSSAAFISYTPSSLKTIDKKVGSFLSTAIAKQKRRENDFKEVVSEKEAIQLEPQCILQSPTLPNPPTSILRTDDKKGKCNCKTQPTKILKIRLKFRKTGAKSKDECFLECNCCALVEKDFLPILH